MTNTQRVVCHEVKTKRPQKIVLCFNFILYVLYHNLSCEVPHGGKAAINTGKKPLMTHIEDPLLWQRQAAPS